MLVHSRSAPRSANAPALSSQVAARHRGRSSATSAAATRLHASARSAAIRAPETCSWTPSQPIARPAATTAGRSSTGSRTASRLGAAVTAVDAIVAIVAQQTPAASSGFSLDMQRVQGDPRSAEREPLVRSGVCRNRLSRLDRDPRAHGRLPGAAGALLATEVSRPRIAAARALARGRREARRHPVDRGSVHDPHGRAGGRRRLPVLPGRPADRAALGGLLRRAAARA